MSQDSQVIRLSVSPAVEDGQTRAAIEYVLGAFARYAKFQHIKLSQAHGTDVVFHYSSSVLPGATDARLTLHLKPIVKTFSPFTVTEPLNFTDLLKAAQPGGLSQFVRTGAPGVLTLQLDIIGAAYWCLTRAEEQTDTRRDVHGRYLAAYSAAPREFYDIPVVNRWFENLAAIIHEQLGLPYTTPREQQTIALTHDVDLMRKYSGAGSLGRSALRMLRSPSDGLRDLKAATAVNFSGARDPYDSFDDLYSIKERISAHSTFFMMTGTGGQHDCDYRLDHPAARNLMLRARTFGDEVGVHPSWDSGTSADLIARETSAVGAANGQPVIGSRQHYLRFAAPQSWRHLVTAGVRYDSSLGFPDYSGFRCGWSGPFRPFDVETMQELPILEIPLVCMDVTLAAYEKLPAELCLERLTNLLDASTDHIRGGALVFLWHNSIADRSAFPGYWDTFEYFFSIASGSARFVRLNELCDTFLT